MSVSIDDVKRLAELARLHLTETEVEKMRSEIESILSYVDTIQKVPLPEGITKSSHLDVQNVMRQDGEPHESGKHTKDLVDQFPDRDGDYLKVRKILG